QEFKSEHLRRAMQRYGVQVQPNAPHNKQANGVVERFIKTFKSVLLAATIDAPERWRERLPGARSAYMAHVSAARGYSAFELLHGAAPALIHERRLAAYHGEPAFASLAELKEFVRAAVKHSEAAAVAQRARQAERNTEAAAVELQRDVV